MNQLQLQKANKFLNGELSYQVGVSVFLECSTNKALKRFFLLPENQQRTEKLKYELQKITKQYEESTQTTVPYRERKDELRTSSTSNVASNERQSNQDIQERFISDRYSHSSDSNSIAGISSLIEQEQKNCYRKRGYLHGQLHAARTDAQRHELALEIISIQKRIDKLNQDRNSVNNGSIPGEYMRKDRTASEYMRIRNLKHYISRIQKQLSECSSINQKKKLEAKLSAYQQELNSFL